jgi:hypothetical protein
LNYTDGLVLGRSARSDGALAKREGDSATVGHRSADASGCFAGDQMTKNSQSTHLLRLPPSVKAEVERFTKADGVSINQFVATAVAEKLAAMPMVAFCRAMAIDAGHSRIL